MKHQFTITIHTDNAELATVVRDEAVGAIEDHIESYRPRCLIDCGELTAIESPLHGLYIAKARDEYAADDINIDDDARLSEYDGGAWVQAWVNVANDATIDTALGAIETPAETVDSEGGHCD